MFIDDLEKMVDLLEVVKLENEKAYNKFLLQYSYLTSDEVYKTIQAINGSTLADLYRQAENYYIDELNNRETGLSITAVQAKEVIADFVYNGLSVLYSGKQLEEQIKDFVECCESMAC